MTSAFLTCLPIVNTAEAVEFDRIRPIVIWAKKNLVATLVTKPVYYRDFSYLKNHREYKKIDYYSL